jgi:23S rRNA pseudoU1915 N3-methylase RlmH
MHMRLIAVGDRQPPWVDAAFDDYALRLPKAWQFS